MVGFWRHRTSHVIAAQAGADSPYVFYFKIYYADGVDGDEDLTGGHTGVNAGKMYCGSDCKTDFSDLRFTGPDATTQLSYFLDSKTDGVSALFAVRVTEDVSAEETTVYVYWGNDSAVSLSDAAATFRRVISSGVVLALPMNEGAGATCTDYSGNGNDGAITGASWVTTGKYGNALSFDGDNDNIAIANWGQHADNVGAFHFSFKTPVVLAAENGIFSYFESWNDYLFAYINNAGAVNLNFVKDGVSTVKGVATLTANTEFSLAITQNATNLIGYKNGVLDTSVLYGNWFNDQDLTENSDIEFGLFQTFSDWAGVLNGIFYFSSLTTDEIADLSAYYPQCSTANLGKLYLRSFVNPEPAHGAWGTTEILPLYSARRNRERRLKVSRRTR